MGDVHLDVLFVHSQQFGRNLIGLFALADIDRRSGGELPWPGPLEGSKRTDRSPPEVLVEIVEQTINFLPGRLERPPCLTGKRGLVGFLGDRSLVSVAMTNSPFGLYLRHQWCRAMTG
jgi:hypothetical protein